MNQQFTPLQKIYALLPRLTERDRLRVLHFCEAIVQQKEGKKANRRKRFKPP